MKETTEQFKDYLKSLKERRTVDGYRYTDQDFENHIDYIKDCFRRNFSPYKCLEFMYFEIHFQYRNMKQEVRLGNIVFYKEHLYKIVGISELYPLLDTLNFAPGVVVWEDLKGVQLTDKMLIDFGFELKERSRYGNKYTYPMADWGFTIENSFEKGKWFFGHEFYDSNNENENNISMHFCHNLEFVHTLQNIMFSLANKEIIINHLIYK